MQVIKGYRVKSAKPGFKINPLQREQDHSKQILQDQTGLEKTNYNSCNHHENGRIKYQNMIATQNNKFIKKKIGIWQKKKTNPNANINNTQQDININQTNLGGGRLLEQQHEYDRTIPKCILFDKQKLYFEVLRLKQIQNEINEENLRLKTRINFLQREIQKKMGVGGQNIININSNKQNNNNSNKMMINQTQNSSTFGNSMHNIMAINLKKMLRQSRQQIDSLNNQLKKIKRTLKYTRVAELQIQNQQFSEQISKLMSLLASKTRKQEDLLQILKKKEDIQQKMVRLQKDKENLLTSNKKLNEEKDLVQQNVRLLKQKCNKLSKEVETNKKMNQGLRKQNDYLQKQISEFREQIKSIKPSLRGKVNLNNVKQVVKINQQINKKQQEIKVQNKQEYQSKYKQLQSQFQKLKISYQQLIHKQTSKQIQTQPPKSLQKQSQYYSSQKFQLIQNSSKTQLNPYLQLSPSLKSLSQLLTFRMKGQRYPFAQLEQDIHQAGEKKFKLFQVKSMFQNSPFFLSKNQVQILIPYFFDPKLIESSNKTQLYLTEQTLITKLRILILDFEQITVQKQQQMFLRIAEMVTTYISQLEEAFLARRNGPDQTIKLKNIVELLSQLQIPDSYIDLIISQLSLVSQDLEHLDYVEFFKRFYMGQEGQQLIQQQISKKGLNHMIKQQQIQESQDERKSRLSKPSSNQGSKLKNKQYSPEVQWGHQQQEQE